MTDEQYTGGDTVKIVGRRKSIGMSEKKLLGAALYTMRVSWKPGDKPSLPILGWIFSNLSMLAMAKNNCKVKISYQYLGWLTGCEKRNLQRAISLFIKWGLIERVRNGSKNGNVLPIYKLYPDKMIEMAADAYKLWIKSAAQFGGKAFGIITVTNFLKDVELEKDRIETRYSEQNSTTEGQS